MPRRLILRRLWRGALILIAGLTLAAGFQNMRMSRGPDLAPPPDGALRLATYNVHYINLHQTAGRWSRGDWDRRKGPLDATFKLLEADIVAFQEMESFAGGNDDSNNLAREWLLARNPGYAATAIGDWRDFPSTQPIFYRRSRFKVLEQGWFFFSDTPDVIYSRTFNGSWPAYASWATFEDRDGNRLRIVNVHLDYSSRENRRRSIDLIAERMAPWIMAGETLFLVGDLNALRGSALVRRLETAGVRFLPITGATYHFDRGFNLFGAIDHIGHFGAAQPLGPPMVLRKKIGGVWPADHYPVTADFRLGQ